MKKRSLIALLACMTLSAGAGVATIAVENAPLTTITASADSLDVAAALTAGGTVTLDSDVVLSERVTIKKDTVLDLNGFSISGAVKDDYGMIYVGMTGELTITGNGNITNTSGYAIGNFGKVTVESGTITGTYALYNFAYDVTTHGKATINGGTFDTNATEGGLAIANCGDLTINNGTFNATVDSSAKMTIESGTFEEVIVKDPDYVAVGSATEINGGTFDSLKVITTDTEKPITANNSLTLNTSVTNINAAAKVNGVYYGTFEAAYNAASADDTIELLSDITVDETIVINKNLTIDGGGKTITSTMTATDNRIIDIPKTVANANVTLKNLKIVGSGKGNYSRGVNYNSNGTLTLDKVSISNVKYYAVNLPMSASSGATINVVDSEISGWAAINVWGVGVTVNVTDSTLESVWFDKNWNFGAIVLNNENCKVNLTKTSFAATGEVGRYSDIVLEEKTTEGTSASNTSITLSNTTAKIDAMATVDGVYYGSFETAYNAANVGGTVELAGNLTLTERLEIDKEITLDLGNYAISGAVNDAFGMIYVKKTGKFTVKGNGSITNTAGYAIGNYGEVTIEGGEITGEYALYNFNYNGTLYGTATINGGTFDTNVTEKGLAIANSGVL